jgi:sugar lactone lactonase YvrE
MITAPFHRAFRRALVALSLLSLTGCGSNVFYAAGSSSGGDGSTPGSTTAYFYTVDATSNTILQFHADGAGSATQTSATITLPSGFSTTLLATDPNGLLYVGGSISSNPNAAQVLVYADVTTAPTLTRTVTLASGKLTALAADASGQIYAAQQLTSAPSVNIYAANASSTATPTRSITQSDYLYVNDLAVDASGNLFVCAYNGGIYLVDTFNSSATGTATPNRTLLAAPNSYFGGIAVDTAGHLFVLEQLTIVEFAAAATGTPTPLNSINLPGPSGSLTAESYSNVLRLDTAGNIFVPVSFSNATTTANDVFAFSPTQTGTPTPILQYSPAGATDSTPLGINIPLAVF